MIQLLFILLCLTKAQTKSDTSCNSAYCSSCSDSDTCTACIEGYLLKDGDCLWKEELNCFYDVIDSQCTTCEDDYSLTSEGECISCPDLNGCSKLKGTSCDSGCSSCKNSNTYYNTTTKTCQNDDNFCMGYDSDGVCEYCIAFYYLDDSNKCQEGKIDKCVIYSEETDCLHCEDNLVGDTGECKSYSIDNCEYIDNDDHTKCDKCNDGYQRSNDRTKCFKCNAENCYTCVNEQADECSFCNEGYYLNGVECNSVTPVDNCNTYSTSVDECSRCNDNYWLNDTECISVTTIDNCASYGYSEDECNECDSSYGLIGGECEKCEIDNCINCDDDVTSCIECNSGYTFNNNICVKCTDSNCDTCDSDGKCQLCQTGYFINKDFTCSKCGDWCTRSIDTPLLKCIHSADNCYSSDDECYLFDSDGETCIECQESYTLDNGKCYKYTKSTGYDGIDYGCYSYDYDGYSLYENYETYEPVEGVCENPYIDGDKGTRIVMVCVILVTLLLL